MHRQQAGGWHQVVCAGGQGCASEGPQETGDMGWQKLHGVQQHLRIET